MNTKAIIGGIAVFFVLIFVLFFFPIVTIGAGQRGVVFNNFSGVENRILGEGTHTRIPFVESVVSLPIQTQATQFDENAGTSDSQNIDVKLTVNWHLDPSKVNRIYQNIGDTDSVISRVLTPNTQDAIKAAISKYVALDIQRNRDIVSSNAEGLLQKKLKKYDILVDNLSITNIQFSDQFNQAIEEAQVQQQKAKAAEYAVQTAKNNAEAAVAQAQGEAQANSLKQSSLTPEILQQMAIQKWNGQFPQYFGGGVLPFLNLPVGH